MDFLLNGQLHGALANSSIAQRLLKSNFDPGVLRPFIGDDDRPYITMNTAKGPQTVLMNNTTDATLRIRQWIHLDEAVIKVAKERLKVFGDLRAAGLTYSIPGGLGKTMLQHQTRSDISAATISMNGLRRSESDRPVYDVTNLPLPIIHKDFEFDIREIQASQESPSTPLDAAMAEMSTRRCVEQVEFLTLGISPAASFSYGGGTIYGYSNYPNRITFTITAPTAGGWTPDTLIGNVLSMILASQQAKYYGPWKLYMGLPWTRYLDNDYKPTYDSKTLRQRLRDIDGITGVSTVDYLTGYTMFLVQQSTDVVRAIVGLEPMVVEWDSQGGFQKNFKVIMVMVPQIRCDHNGNTGLVHGAV